VVVEIFAKIPRTKFDGWLLALVMGDYLGDDDDEEDNL